MTFFALTDLGSGADNAIEITVVTSTGEHLTVNSYQYPDLFWALRGGGGGTYGIITSVTYRTYQSLPIAVYIFEANVTNATVMKEFVAGFLQFQTNFTDDGWAAYVTFRNTTVDIMVVMPNMTIDAANASMQAWTNYAASFQSQSVSSGALIQIYPSFYEYYMSTGISFAVGINAMFTSRLLSRDTLAKRSQDIAEIITDCQAVLTCVAPYFAHLLS